MPLPAAVLSLAVLAGGLVGVLGEVSGPYPRAALGAASLGLLIAHLYGRSAAVVACAAAVFLHGSVLLAHEAQRVALASPLRAALDDEFGGFALGTMGPEGAHPPISTRAVLTEDAWSDPPGAQFRARVVAVQLRGEWVTAAGGVSVSVAGSVPPEALAEWRAGRTVIAPLTFRRPARYLNPGVPDHERRLALGGTTLFGSVKSALLVDVESSGSLRQEHAADVRAAVRRSVARFVSPHGPVSGAIVAAILIGDRTGLPGDIRERLQAAGVYHVLAISGGNIAILVGLVLLACRCAGLPGRAATLVTMGVLVVYAQVVVSGPSVFRAVVMAVSYLAARALDHRSPPWQAIAVAAAVSVASDPLDVLDAGFVLTFAATATLLAAVPHLASLEPVPRVIRPAVAAVLASVATEVVLLPVGAAMFERVTLVGILLNIVAIPLMTIVQVAGLGLSLGSISDGMGAWAGWIAHLGALALVESSRLADVLPWLSARVPAPAASLVVFYYASCAGGMFLTGRVRGLACAAALVAGCLIATGTKVSAVADPNTRLTLTVFDVGQAEAMRIGWPGGGSMVVDTGGAPFGSGSFDIGARVLRPALWAQGLRRVETLLITHGDPDHLGGAAAILESFDVGTFLEGIAVPGHRPFDAVRSAALERGARVRASRTGETWREGEVIVRVLSPDPPDWERRRVRNDDSVVLEIRYGDVAVLLAGDISGEVERQILPRLSQAPIRVLKVAHHGSRTSTSAALVDAWKPQVALVSCGRGNRFGHPAPDVMARLERAGAAIYRTDRDGAITLGTDGRGVTVTTYVP